MLERDILERSVTGVREIDSIMALDELVPPEMQVKCWEAKECTHPECPSFGSPDRRCWLQCGTHCHNEIQGTFKQKRDACERCDVYLRNGVRSTEFEHDGRRFTVLVSPLLDDEGKEQGRMVVIHEITELVKAEEELRSRNRDLRVLNEMAAVLAESMNDLDEVLDPVLEKVLAAVGASAGMVVSRNPGGESLRVRASVGVSQQTQVHVSLLPAGVLEEFSRGGEKGIFHGEEELARLKTLRPILEREHFSRPVLVPLTAVGKTVGFLAVADRDKDTYGDEELRLLESAAVNIGVALENADLFRTVERAKSTWETTFDAMNEAIYVLDADQNVVMANRAAGELLDMPLEMVIGRKCYELTHEKCEPPANCAFRDVMESGEAATFEVREKALSMILRVDMCPVKDDDGRVVGVVHVINDLTEKRRMRQQLINSEKMAAVGQLVAGMAHEINNPLTGIIGYAQLLLSRQPQEGDSSQQDDLEAIIGEAKRAADIVQKLFTFASSHKTEKCLVDVNEIVRNVAGLKEYELGVKNIRLELDLGKGLPRTMADARQLEQVMLNLVSNAEKATEDKGGHITITTGQSDDSLVVSVADDGVGIEAADMERVFEPFFTTREVGHGAGLGLSICYGIIEEHDGHMEIDSRPGEGTEVSFTLPVSNAVVNEDVEETLPPSVAPGEGEADPPLAGRNVLLVGGELAELDELVRLLAGDGHRVEVATDTGEALQKMAAASFDRVITGIDEDELYRRISEIDPALAANVIFIDGIGAGGNGGEGGGRPGRVIRRPFDIEELRRKLR